MVVSGGSRFIAQASLCATLRYTKGYDTLYTVSLLIPLGILLQAGYRIQTEMEEYLSYLQDRGPNSGFQMENQHLDEDSKSTNCINQTIQGIGIISGFSSRALQPSASDDSPNVIVHIELVMRIASKQWMAPSWMSIIHWIVEKQQPNAN
ncbi:hypothetical protein KQX54_011029 [Cotesia glomerata]|uniref:Uncharacterized protein n=1 Tax=Cotesia glomerata TaxID=32391 RepID=A0AAV7IPA1_COTGL|nr:hypothetical protein KQX54_011029 [Cotesia glomerata]